ncbi:hypothetical protein C2845_PM17G12940 [Panicum miliaceum]|uniref:Uncharacterized protein n=1 Tax=Panicum miliaceum TaxID=4540 RepID=A0A3L6Q4A6_PANMI|nr:hypothetical protein C2845_PM17G12940 [Panicum miliaceum]
MCRQGLKIDAMVRAECARLRAGLEQARKRQYHALSCDKKLLTPQPRLRTGFFSVLDSQMIPAGCIPEARTSVGAGKPIVLDERIKVDLIVIGSSVAVDPSSGAQLGKGDDYTDEWDECIMKVGTSYRRNLRVSEDRPKVRKTAGHSEVHG